MGGAGQCRNFLQICADDLGIFGHDDDLGVVVGDNARGHEGAGLWRDVHGEDAGAAAILDFVFGKGGLLAIAVRADERTMRDFLRPLKRRRR